MSKLFNIFFVLMFSNEVFSAPTKKEERTGKSLAYYDYVNTNEAYSGFANNDFVDYEDNDISRNLPKRKPVKNRYDSPIYYIRLPPQPYMFVPGLGYISHQPAPPPHVSQFVNLPINFLANGKPSTIYQWNGAVDKFPDMQQNIPQQPPDSAIHRLPGKYSFNGKPNDIYVLRDSYNSLYGDALQNFYP